MVIEYLNPISFFLFAAFCWYIAANKKGPQSHTIIEKIYISLAATFFVFAITSLLWTTVFFTPTFIDSLAAGSIINALVILILAILIYSLSRESSILIITVLLLITAFALGGTFFQFFLALWLVSEIVGFLIFLNLFTVHEKHYRTASYFGIIYFGINIYFLGLVSNGLPYNELPLIIPLIFLGLFLYIISRHKMPISSQVKAIFPRFESSITFFALRATFFLTALFFFVAVSTVSLHELGHAATSKIEGCNYVRAVVFEDLSLPHSQIECESIPSIFLITLGGLLGTMIVGFIFLISANLFATRLGYLIIGLGLFLVQRDLIELGIPIGINALVMGAAALITLMAVIEIAAAEFDNLHAKLMR